jgi:16S rRNA (uracil1498-N3)-methyltransferase
MTRLYYPGDLYANHMVTLNHGQTHYLRHVLRAAVGHKIFLFNESHGEWSAVITDISKSSSSVMVKELVRTAVSCLEISLLFAPIKHDPLTFLVEKATELGVKHFFPVLTERCNIARINEERVQRNVIEAAQQCERFDIPTVHSLMSLHESLASWNAQIPLVVCQERDETSTFVEEIGRLPSKKPIGFFVGPEGGFSSQEFNFLRSFSFTRFINLGPRILRAETAALSAIACYQATKGDWC